MQFISPYMNYSGKGDSPTHRPPALGTDPLRTCEPLFSPSTGNLKRADARVRPYKERARHRLAPARTTPRFNSKLETRNWFFRPSACLLSLLYSVVYHFRPTTDSRKPTAAFYLLPPSFMLPFTNARRPGSDYPDRRAVFLPLCA